MLPVDTFLEWFWDRAAHATFFGLLQFDPNMHHTRLGMRKRRTIASLHAKRGSSSKELYEVISPLSISSKKKTNQHITNHNNNRGTIYNSMGKWKDVQAIWTMHQIEAICKSIEKWKKCSGYLNHAPNLGDLQLNPTMHHIQAKCNSILPCMHQTEANCNSIQTCTR